MPSTNPDDFVDEELDELERRLEQELQALEGQDDGGASEMIRARPGRGSTRYTRGPRPATALCARLAR